MSSTRIPLPSGTLHLTPDRSLPFYPESLCGFAARQNPKRGFLFVSKVLGKHIPVAPARMASTHALLASGLQAFLQRARQSVFIGFAETATGLGAGVFEAAWRCMPERAETMLFMQTTRYRMQHPLALDFQEEHSHATGHLLYAPAGGLHHADALVLIDDELTTGNTNANFLRAFLRISPQVRRVAMVSLLNWMSPERKQALQAAFPGVEIEYVSLAGGQMHYTPDPSFACPPMPVVEGTREFKDAWLDPAASARYGWTVPLRLRADLARQVRFPAGSTIRVVGDGELMHAAYLVAQALDAAGFETTVQSTTRSPILLGGAITERVTFQDHYGDGIVNFLYNPPAVGAQVVFVHESRGPLNLLNALPGRTIQALAAEDILG